MNKPFAVIFIAAGASVLSGCPAGKGGVDYSPSQPRVVEPAREVNIEGTQTPLGAGAGAAVGGLAQADAATEILAEVGRLDALAAALEQHGWRVARDAGGALLLFPPGDRSVTEPTRKPATSPVSQAGTGDVTVTPGDLDRLGRELTKHGWRTEHNADGDLLLFPPSDKSVTEPTWKPATSPASQAGTGDVTVTPGDLDRLGRELTKHGWRTEHNADGDLLLFPPSDKSVTQPAWKPATVPATQAGTGNVTVPSGDLDTLGRELTKRGWRVARDADGHLLVFPIGDAP